MTAPFLVLHGLEGSPEGSKVRALRDAFGNAVIAPDQRRMIPETRLEVIENAMDASFPDTIPLVVGSSLGGWLAAVLAARHPGRIASLLLLAPAFFRGKRPPLPEDYPDGRAFLESLERLPSLPAVTCAAHVVIAEQDTVIPRAGQDRWLFENAHATSEVWADDHRLDGSRGRLVTAVRGILGP